MRYLADENFNNQIIRGLLRRVETAKFIRVQDTDLYGKPDPELLAYAVVEDLILITHDVNIMRAFFYERLNAGLPVPTLFLVPHTKSVGDVIASLELIELASQASEWAGQIHYLPL